MKFITALLILTAIAGLGFFLYSPNFFGKPAFAVPGALKLINPQLPSMASCTLTGASATATQATITGSGFTNSPTCQVKVGDRVTLGTETKTVTAVTNNTSLTVTPVFAGNQSGTLTVLPSLMTVTDAGGNIKMVMDDQGNLGVGNNPPSTRLDIGGTTSLITNTSGNLTITPATNLIVSSGNVGIGTTAPGQKLEIAGSAILTGNSNLFMSNSSNYLYGTTNLFQVVGQSTEELIAANYLNLKTTASNALFGIFFSTANTERMRIDNSGNVGIGNTAPAARLDMTNGGSALALKMTASGNGFAITTDPAFTSFQTANNVYLSFGTNGSERMRISGAGVISGATYGFGGIYGNLVSNGACQFSNPYTSACSCPSGFTAQGFGRTAVGADQAGMNWCSK